MSARIAFRFPGRRFLPWTAAWLSVLAASIGLSVWVVARETLPGDVRLLQEVQGWPFPGESLSDFIRGLTTTQFVLAIGAVLAVVLWLFGRRQEALLLAAGLVVLPLLQHGLKELIDRPRPGPDVAELRAGYSSPSFPAGHVMSGTLLYGFLLYLALRRMPVPLALAAGGFSLFVLLLAGPVNVYLGVHWPSDVLGGYLWGLVVLLPLVAVNEAVPERIVPLLPRPWKRRRP